MKQCGKKRQSSKQNSEEWKKKWNKSINNKFKKKMEQINVKQIKIIKWHNQNSEIYFRQMGADFKTTFWA